jgi:RNA polymerase sigma factor (sigma-70 family)
MTNKYRDLPNYEDTTGENREKAIMHYYRFVKLLAKKYSIRYNADKDDLLQAGCMGLIDAVDTFKKNGSRPNDVIFKKWASYKISYGMFEGMRQQEWFSWHRRIGLPVKVYRVANKIERYKHDTRDKYNDISNELDFSSIREMINKYDNKKRIVLIESFYNEKTDVEISKILGVTKQRIHQIKKEAISKLKNDLNIRS